MNLLASNVTIKVYLSNVARVQVEPSVLETGASGISSDHPVNRPGEDCCIGRDNGSGTEEMRVTISTTLL
jgi:hypothetical protein